MKTDNERIQPLPMSEMLPQTIPNFISYTSQRLITGLGL